MQTTIKRTIQTVGFIEADSAKLAEIQARYPDDIEVPSLSDGQNFVVKTANEEVGYLSIVERDNEILLTQLYIFPDFRGCGIGTMVLEVLSTMEGVDFVRVIATPGTAQYYVDRGFEQDLGNIILTKVAQ